MRLIKFRAWDKLAKQMRYQDKEFFHVALRRNLNGNEFWKECANAIDNFFTPDQGEIMQFTGFHDKNGKEAYFEDIYKDRNGSVKVIDSDCSYYEMDLIEADFDDGVVIIGNTFENPELLKGGVNV